MGWPPSADQVEAARSGDRSQMSAILAEGYPRLMSFLMGLGLDLHLAEEIASETCEGVVAGIGRLRAPQAFEAWFWAVARNRLRSGFRRRRRGQPVEAEVSPTTPEESALEKEEHSRIRAAMTELSQRDRELLWLREVELLSYEEIGSRLGAAVGTIRVACHRARRRLGEIYAAGEAD
jgi:RNA polymerase sigma-70 factor (ECF subfamily)